MIRPLQSISLESRERRELCAAERRRDGHEKISREIHIKNPQKARSLLTSHNTYIIIIVLVLVCSVPELMSFIKTEEKDYTHEHVL